MAKIISGTNGDDVINGEVGDTVYGLGGNDSIRGTVLDGGAGADTMVGLSPTGGNVFYVDHADDQIAVSSEPRLVNNVAYIDPYVYFVFDARHDGIYRLPDGVDEIIINADDDWVGDYGPLFLAGPSINKLTGSQFSDHFVLKEFDASEPLSVDLAGGNDFFMLNGSGRATLNGGDGNDTISARFGNVTLAGGAGNDMLSGGRANDLLSGGSGDDVLRGGQGDDVYLFDAGDEFDVAQDADTTVANSGTDVIRASISVDLTRHSFVDNVELLAGNINATGDAANNLLTGGSGANMLSGGAGNDTLVAVGGNDVLEGGAGNDQLIGVLGDTLRGGEGDDTYVIRSVGAVIGETVAGGRDTQEFHVPFDLLGSYALAEHVEIGRLVSAEAFSLAGNTTANLLQGNAQANRLQGLAGNDTLEGGAGDDQLLGDDDADLLLGDAGRDSLLGGSGDDTLLGGTDADTLDGGLGNDVLSGQAGADVYDVALGAGQDVIDEADASAGLGDVVRIGALAAAITGVTLAVNGDLTLSDQRGGSLLVKGQLASSGAGHIERFEFADGTVWGDAELRVRATLVGLDSAADVMVGDLAATNRLDGLGGDDALYGGDLQDTLWGGAGNDSLAGYRGNDSLLGGAGRDLLVGGDGKDTLDGGADADTLEGGAGNDLYLIDGAADVVVEVASGGRDTVRGSSSFTVAEHIEVAALMGDAHAALTGHATADQRLTGNLGDNVIRGGSGRNVIYGGLGNDVLVGGAGTDFYQLADDDLILERADDEGLDVVMTLLEHTDLADHIEYLQMTEGFAYSANGSNQDNIIYGTSTENEIDGQAGDDELNGRGGDDLLRGSLGYDTLRGGEGADTYLYRRGDGADVIDDRDASGATDVLNFENISSNALWFSKQGDDLLISHSGTDGEVRIQSWYRGAQYQVERISAEGRSLDASGVNTLVQAMAGMSPDTLVSGTPAQLVAVYQAMAQVWA